MIMTKKEFDSQVQLQKMLSNTYHELVATIESEEFKQSDVLNTDMAIAQINGLRTLLGITSIRIGLNAHKVQEQRSSEDINQTKEISNEQEGAATEETKSK